jgi:hypothetical protein
MATAGQERTDSLPSAWQVKCRAHEAANGFARCRLIGMGDLSQDCECEVSARGRFRSSALQQEQIAGVPSTRHQGRSGAFAGKFPLRTAVRHSMISCNLRERIDQERGFGSASSSAAPASNSQALDNHIGRAIFVWTVYFGRILEHCLVADV